MGAPFGLSISDITKAIKLAHDIYERCCNEQQSASEFSQRLSWAWASE